MTARVEARATAPVRVAAWALAAVIVALAVAYAVLYLLILSYPFDPYGFPGAIGIFSVTAAIIGALIASRHPRNGVGWVLLAASLCLGLTATVQVYAIRTYFVAPGSLPAGWLAAWLGSWLWAAGVPIIAIFLPLLFPDSRLDGWLARLLFAFAVLGTVALAGGLAMLTFPYDGVAEIGPDAQLIGSHSIARFPAFGVIYSVLPLGAFGALLRLGLRLRQSTGEQRQQFKWFAYACAIVALGLLVSSIGNFSPGRGTATSTDLLGRASAAILVGSLLAIPIGAGIAILRYRLYDIDVVISRTIVYGALAVMITATYVGIVVGIGTLVGTAGQNNVLLSIVATAVVAVAFQPLRGRLQRVANRVVYGRRATPYEVLTAFSEGVAETYAGEDVLDRMARLLADATEADQALVWIRVGDYLRPAAAAPDRSLPAEVYDVNGHDLPELGRNAVAVRERGELLGALTVARSRADALTPVESKLLADLALQAGLVLRNAGLAEALKLRLDDLRESRQRLVAAQDAERRRLERNLHDGAQQNLVALKVKLGLAKALSARDPAKTAELLEQMATETDDAIETLRDLARGIYPPLLADKGLAAALNSQARKATLPVTVDADGVGRYPQEVEAAIYFCALEALQNVQKYAGASQATVRLRQAGGELSFEVEDDGDGFDAATVQLGSGITNMGDRLDALGGDLVVDSTPGRGTRLRGVLPAPSTAS